MAKVNVQGRVYGGQEGSGQAQILTPFDATKFPQQEMAVKEQDKAANLDAMAKRKMPDVEIKEIPEYWQVDPLIKEFSGLEQTVMQNEMKMNEATQERMALNPLDPNNYNRMVELDQEIYKTAADTNNLIRSQKANLEQTMQHKKLWETDKARFDLDSDNYSEDSQYNLAIFPNLSLKEQQQMLVDNGGSLVEQKASYTDWAKSNVAYLKEFGEKLGFSGMPQVDESGQFYYVSSVDGLKYDYDKLNELTLASMWDKAGLLSEIKRQPELEAAIIEYYGKDNINAITKKETYNFLKETDIGKEFVDMHMPEEWRKTKRSAGQMRTAQGRVVTLTPEDLATETEGNEQIFADPNVLQTVNKVFNKNNRLSSGEKVSYSGGYTASKQDYTQQGDSQIPTGFDGVILDQTSNKEIDLATNTVIDKKEGTYITSFVALKDITYQRPDGTFKTIPEGEGLTIEEKKMLQSGKDFTPRRTYIGSGYVTESKTNKTIPTTFIQNSLGYIGASEERANEEFNYQIQEISRWYNYDINGVKAKDIILSNAEARAKAEGRTAIGRDDLYYAQETFDKEMSSGKTPTVMSSGAMPTQTTGGGNFDPTNY